MRTLILVALLSGLAACGVDGAPTPPAKPGVTISGTAKVGVSGSL
ncbi:MAG: argininosuccinate lyase [Paracoccaceae bacterium]